MTRNEIEYLRATRTLTQAEVDARGREHDRYDLTPAERLDNVSHCPEPEPSRH